MSFLGSSSPFMNSYGGGYSSYGGNPYSSMYGSGYGGVGGMSNNYNQQQNPALNGDQQMNGINQQNPEYQFDLRRDMQATIGGLNASLGLAFGVSQMLNLSTIGIKYLLKAVKYVIIKVFDINNVITPVKFLMRVVFGTDFTNDPHRQQSFDYLEQIWNSSKNNPTQPQKILGLSPALFKSLILALLGVVIQFTLFLLKRGKNQQLEKMLQDEENERKRLMEEEWKQQELSIYPELSLIKDIDQVEIEEVKAYDGDLNQMSFNHIKNSKAFDNNKMKIIDELDEEDISFFDTADSINVSDYNKSNSHKHEQLIQRSEDGWK